MQNFLTKTAIAAVGQRFFSYSDQAKCVVARKAKRLVHFYEQAQVGNRMAVGGFKFDIRIK